MLKQDLRRTMRAALDGVDDARRARDSAAVVAPLLALAGDGPVALFASMGHELDTGPLDDALCERGIVRLFPEVRGGELVFRALPADVRGRDLPRASYGAPSPGRDHAPAPLSSCSLVVVPGLAFDLRGGRIGYGRGFYDRALAGIDVGRAVGLGYDAQLVDEVPMDERDVRLRRLCTPSRGVFPVL